MQAKIGKIDQYILDLVGNAIRIQGNWNASTNDPDISSTTNVGYAWVVSVAGSTDLGGITDWKIGDMAVKTATGWIKVDNTEPDLSGLVKLDQTPADQVTIGEFKFPKVYIKGTTNVPLAPTLDYATITYLNPAPTNESITQTDDGSGTFECGGLSTNVNVWGITVGSGGGSSITDTVDLAYAGAGSVTDKRGMRFTTLQAVTLTKVTKSPAVTATLAYLEDSSHNTIETSSFIGNEATFNSALSDSTDYYIVVDDGGYNYDQAYNGGVSFPIIGTFARFTTGYFSGADQAGYTIMIESITATVSSTLGDKEDWSSTPLIQQFTDSNSVYSVGDPYISGVSEHSIAYYVGDPSSGSGYSDTSAGSFIDQTLDISIWGYRNVGGVFLIHSQYPTTASVSDYTATNFQGQFSWSSGSDCDGYIVQCTPDGGSNYYYIDVGNNTSYTVEDSSFSSWNSGSFTPNNYYVDYGGNYMYGQYYDFYIWSYYDSPLGRVFSPSYSIYGSFYCYGDYRGASISYSTGTNETGVMLMRTPDYGSSWEYKDMGVSSGFYGTIIDDGHGWTSGQADVSSTLIASKFFIDSDWSSSDYTSFLVVYSDNWNSSGALRYAYVLNNSTIRIESGTWDLLSNDTTLETWVNAHLSQEPSGTEVADGVTRTINVYGRTVYLGATAYSPTPLTLSFPIANNGKRFYLNAGWTSPSPSPTGYKVIYGTNYGLTTGTSYSTSGATWGSDSTITPTSYGSDAKVYSDYWYIDEAGYSFVGTGSLTGTLTDATTATRSGMNTFTGNARFIGAVDQTLVGYDRVDIGVQANSPRIIFESANTAWQIDNDRGLFRWYLPGSVKLTMSATQITAYIASAFNAGLTGTTATLTGQTQTSNLVVQNAYTNHLSQYGIHFNNTSSSGQNVFTNTISSKKLSVWRTDYLGGVTWAAGQGASSQGTYSGYHDFYTGGDYGSGASSKKQMTLRSSYYSNVAAKCAEGSIGLLMGTGDNPYTEFDLRHKMFFDTTLNAFLFDTTALGSRAAVEGKMYMNFNVIGTSYFGNKVVFTQTDGNEYIDSLNDGYMDYAATTGHRLNIGGVTKLIIGSSTATFTGNVIAPVGAAGTPSYTFTGDENTGMYQGGADILNFATSGTARFQLGATGEASFGTSPSTNIWLRVFKSLTQNTTTQTNIYTDGIHTLNAANAIQYRGVYSGPSLNQAGFAQTSATSGGGAIPAFFALPQATGASGSVTNVTGYFSSPRNTGAGTVSQLIGFSSGVGINSGGGVVTNNYGFYTADQAVGTNNYGFYSTLTAGTGKWAFYSAGDAQNYFAGNVGIGVAPSGTRASVAGANDGTSGAKSLVTTLGSTLTGEALYQFNQQIYTTWNPSANTNSNSLRGTVNQLIKQGNYNATSGLLTNLQANYAVAQGQGSGNIQGLAGFSTTVGADTGFSGTITNVVSFQANSPLSASGTITNAYGLYIDEQKKSVVTNAFGVYQVGANDINYFAGNVGVGVSPLAKLHSQATTEQLRLGYSATKYVPFTVDASGNLTIAPVGLATTMTGTLSTVSKNMLLGMQNQNDPTMTGDYDRNVLQNVGVWGIVTRTVTGAFTSWSTTDENALFDSSEGSRNRLRGADATTSVEIHIDTLANQQNYSSAQWQPFVQYRTFASYSFFKNIVVSFSADNVNWFTAVAGSHDTADCSAGARFDGLWQGTAAGPTVPSTITVWRYVKFVFSNYYTTGGGTNPGDVYFSEIGIRHLLSPYHRKYIQNIGGSLYGAYNFYANGTITSPTVTIDSATGLILSANLSGTNTGDQVGDGVTITGAGTVADPFVSVGGAKDTEEPKVTVGNGASLIVAGTTGIFWIAPWAGTIKEWKIWTVDGASRTITTTVKKNGMTIGEDIDLTEDDYAGSACSVAFVSGDKLSFNIDTNSDAYKIVIQLLVEKI